MDDPNKDAYGEHSKPDEWDKIAEGLLACGCINKWHWKEDFCPAYRPAVAAKLREMGEEIERLKSDLRDERALTDEDYSKIELENQQLKAAFELRGEALESQKSAASQFSADMTVEFERLKAGLAAAQQEIERLKEELGGWVKSAGEDGLRIIELEAERDAAYLKGLEDAKITIPTAVAFVSGDYRYGYFRGVAGKNTAIQSRIDEAKGK